MLNQQYPSIKDFEYSEYERYKEQLKEGEFLSEIPYNEAIAYFNNNIVSDKIIQFTLTYIESQVETDLKMSYVHLKGDLKQQITDIKRQQGNIFTTMLYNPQEQNYSWTALVYNSINGQLLALNDKQQIYKQFQAQQLIEIDLQTRDMFSAIVIYLINVLNAQDISIQLPKANYNYPHLMKWVILKYHRNKVRGTSYSKLLDGLDQTLNQSQQQQSRVVSQQKSQQQKTLPQMSRISSEQFNQKSQILSQSQQQQQSQSQILSQNSFNQQYTTNQFLDEESKSLSKISSYRNVSKIQQQDLSNIMNQFKQDILNQSKISKELPQQKYFLDKLPQKYDQDNVNQVFKIRIEELEKLMKDSIQIQQAQTIDKQPLQDLQYLLDYYYQHNPEQYKVLLDQYSNVIHQQMFERMGFKTEQPQNSPQSQKSQQSNYYNSQRQSVSFLSVQQKPNIVKNSNIFQKVVPQPEELATFRYGIKITRKELEQLKTKFILSQNFMDYYFAYLNEQFKRLLIMPTKFYLELKQTNYQAVKGYTEQYFGKNRTIFDLFDKLLIPVKVSQYEYIGVYFDFISKILYYINTLERRDSKNSYQLGNLPIYKEIIENPIVITIVKYVEAEYNNKVMRIFNILNWQIIEFQSQYAQNFNHSPLVLAYIFDALANNQSCQFENHDVKNFVQRILNTIRKKGPDMQLV